MYAIRSDSEKGTFFLVKDWRKNRAIWSRYLDFGKCLFKTESAAKASLTKLLKVMDEYAEDAFTVILLDSSNAIISKTAYKPAA